MGPRRKPSANLACLRVLQTEPASNGAWTCRFWNPYTQTSSFGVRYPNNQFGEFFLRPRHPKKRVDRSPLSDLTKSHQRLMMFEWQDIQNQYIPESSNVGVSQHEPPLCILRFTSDRGSWIVRHANVLRHWIWLDRIFKFDPRLVSPWKLQGICFFLSDLTSAWWMIFCKKFLASLLAMFHKDWTCVNSMTCIRCIYINTILQYYIFSFNSSSILLNHLSPSLFPIFVFLSYLGSRYEQSASLQFSSLESWSTDTCTTESLRWDSRKSSRHDVVGEAGDSWVYITPWWLSWSNWESHEKHIFGHGYFQIQMGCNLIRPWSQLLRYQWLKDLGGFDYASSIIHSHVHTMPIVLSHLYSWNTDCPSWYDQSLYD